MGILTNRLRRTNTDEKTYEIKWLKSGPGDTCDKMCIKIKKKVSIIWRCILTRSLTKVVWLPDTVNFENFSKRYCAFSAAIVTKWVSFSEFLWFSVIVFQSLKVRSTDKCFWKVWKCHKSWTAKDVTFFWRNECQSRTLFLTPRKMETQQQATATLALDPRITKKARKEDEKVRKSNWTLCSLVLSLV